MTKTEQTAKGILDLINNLRTQIKNDEVKIASLEVAYEALTGSKPPTDSKNGLRDYAKAFPGQVTPTNGRRSRRGVRIDRHGARKTFEFLKERGEKTTTASMVARKFNISAEAAGQRLLKLFQDGQIVRVAKGQYVAATTVQRPSEGQPSEAS